jgi:hypothetical protein
MKVVLTIIALVLICAAFAIGHYEYRSLLGKEVADGRVVKLEPQKSDKGSTLYIIVAEFNDREGNCHTYRSGFSSSNPGYKVGDNIRIYFDRNNPSKCGVLSFGYRFGVAWILGCVAIALLLVQVGFRFGNQWLEERFPTTVINSFQQTSPI